MDEVLNPAHPTRAVVRRRLAGRDVVVKRHGADVAARVWADLHSLWDSPLGSTRTPPAVPEPLGPRAGWDVTVPDDEVWTAYVPGTPLVTGAVLGDVPARLTDVVAILADLNTCGAVVPRRRSLTKLLLSVRRKAITVGGRLGESVEAVAAALDHVRPTAAPLVVNHGDFTPRNLLASGPHLVIVDFDRLQMADPVHDVAHLGAWLWAVHRIHDGVGDWTLADAAARAHAGLVPDGRTADERATALTVHRAIALVRIATSWTLMREDPALAGDVVGQARRLADDLTRA